MIGQPKMIYKKFIKNHVAVSSLESEEHAKNKDPKIITVSWFIGKRCNYDCSYCNSFTHDNYSPHIKKENAFNFIDQLEKYCTEIGKRFKISITGGEPFVHPNFLEILEYIHNKKNLIQLAVVTNGSLPYETYQKSSSYITNISVSLHLEQDNKTLNDNIDRIIRLNSIKSWFFNVNLMFLPSKLSLVKSIIKKFNDNNVKFILRKIDPPYENKNEVVRKKDIKTDNDFKNLEKNFIKNKILKKTLNNTTIDERHKIYYSQEELNYFNSYKNWNKWENIRLYTDKDILEINTDDLKSNNLNIWKGWQCYIGIDSLYVQHEGTIYRANCMQGEPIGKIGEKIKWPNETLICPLKYCTCNNDMVIRKIKHSKYKNLIDNI